MVARVKKVARYRDRQTGMVARVAKFARYRDRQTGMVRRVVDVARYRDRQIGMVARYRDIYTDRYGSKGCKGCEVHRHIDRQVLCQGLQSLQGTEKYKQTGMVAMVPTVARYRDI